MLNWIIKIAMVGFVAMMAGVFFWQPISATFSGMTTTNDFVLESTDGAVDTKAMRGKVLALMFGYAECGEHCADRLAKAAQAYNLLTSGERSRVAMILISVDERDTPAKIAAAVKKVHPDFIGATGTPEQVKTIADAFGADIQKPQLADGSRGIAVSPMIYVVDAEGKYASVLNEAAIGPEKVATALRAKLPATLPAGMR